MLFLPTYPVFRLNSKQLSDGRCEARRFRRRTFLFLAVLFLGSGYAEAGAKKGDKIKYKAAIYEKSCASRQLFEDVMNILVVQDRIAFPEASRRELVDIKIEKSYINSNFGVELWKVRHDKKNTFDYIVIFHQGPNGGTSINIKYKLDKSGVPKSLVK